MSEKRRPGRPKTTGRPKVNWDQVDKLAVYGEKVTDHVTGQIAVYYPSHRELAARFEINKSTVAYHGKRLNWTKRRKLVQSLEKEGYEEKLVELRSETRALSTADLVDILDRWLEQFGKAVKEQKVPQNNPSDANTLMRLREFLLGNADSRSEVQGAITLEAIQLRHRDAQMTVDVSPEMAGVLPELPPAESEKAKALPSTKRRKRRTKEEIKADEAREREQTDHRFKKDKRRLEQIKEKEEDGPSMAAV